VDLGDLLGEPLQLAFERAAEWLFAPSPRPPRTRTTVPLVTGFTVEQGRRVLEQYDLELRLAGAAADPAASMIRSQKPKPGTSVRTGSAVIVRGS
jgi:beta-lactam-binding protein with PASTA domain